MAATDVNQSPKMFDRSGTVVISKSGHASSPATLKNIIPGSFKFTEPFCTRVEQSDAGTQQIPQEGTDTFGEAEISFHAGRWVAADIRDLLMGAGSASTNQVYTFDTIEFSRMLGVGGTIADQLTMSNAWLAEPLTYEAGGGTNGLDKWTAKFKCRKADWAWSAT